MSDFLKRTWAEVNLNAICDNFMAIKRQVKKGTKILCVLKADAYGHGATALAEQYEKMGADWFAVSNLEEALQLRNSMITKPILILGYTPANMARVLSTFNISQAVFTKSYAEELSKAALEANCKVNAHVKLDTGMSRIGFIFHDKKRDLGSLLDIKEISALKGINLEGIFTHFAKSDEGGEGIVFTKHQYENFCFAVRYLKENGIDIPLKHCSNSAAILNYKEMNMDMVRAGLILYGFYPSDYNLSDLNLKPAIQLKTVISQLKTIEKNTAVSYGGKFITKRKTKIATVPIGYADGYLRVLSGKAYMLINGQKAKVVGRICMDQLMLDVTDVDNININDEVVVFGKSKDAEITLDELSAMMGTINYEFLCLLSKRIPRIYLKDNKTVSQLNYLCP